MLRAAVHIIITVILMISTTGFTISKHYCGTHLVSVSVNDEPKSCCDDMQGSCCHNESEHFQLTEDFASVTFDFQFNNDFGFELASLPQMILMQLEEQDGYPTYPVYADASPPPDIHTHLAQLQRYIL